MTELPPISFEEDIKKYEAYEEKTETKSTKCPHTSVKIVNGQLRCACGASWGGARIDKLYTALKSRA